MRRWTSHAAEVKARSAAPQIAALHQSPASRSASDSPANCAGTTCAGAQTKAELMRHARGPEDTSRSIEGLTPSPWPEDPLETEKPPDEALQRESA